MSGSYYTGVIMVIMMQYTIVNCIKLKSWHKTSVTITMGPVMKVIEILAEESILVSGRMITPPFDLGTFCYGNVIYGTTSNWNSIHFFHLETIAPGKPGQTGVASPFFHVA